MLTLRIVSTYEDLYRSENLIESSCSPSDMKEAYPVVTKECFEPKTELWVTLNPATFRLNIDYFQYSANHSLDSISAPACTRSDCTIRVQLERDMT